jgi:gas vesicle protein
MGEDPDTIRDEIADTRERMGDTIDALGYKADVKTRAKDNVAGKVDSVKESLGLAGQKASDVTPDAEQVKGQVRKAAGLAQENPLGLAVGALAVGFLAGMLVPSSRVEDEKLGPMADKVKEQAKETRQEALERGKQVAQSAAQSAADTVSEEGQKHGEELADSAKENAGAVGQ